jgi:phosphatidylinositol glycan class N
MAIAAYTGWAAYASLFIFRPLDTYAAKSSGRAVITGFAGIALATFWVLFGIQRSPWTYYLYIAFPCYFWQQFMVQTLPLLHTSVSQIRRIGYIRILLYGGLGIAVLQSMVVSIQRHFYFPVMTISS